MLQYNVVNVLKICNIIPVFKYESKTESFLRFKKTQVSSKNIANINNMRH